MSYFTDGFGRWESLLLDSRAIGSFGGGLLAVIFIFCAQSDWKNETTPFFLPQFQAEVISAISSPIFICLGEGSGLRFKL